MYIYKESILIRFFSSDWFKDFKTLKEVKESIKKALVNHDGYNPNIIIK